MGQSITAESALATRWEFARSVLHESNFAFTFRLALVWRCLQCKVLLQCVKRFLGHLKTIGQGSSLLLAPAG